MIIGEWLDSRAAGWTGRPADRRPAAVRIGVQPLDERLAPAVVDLLIPGADAPVRSPAMSADGRFVAFVSSASNLVPGDTNNADDVFVRDRLTGTTERLRVGPAAYRPAISADGRRTGRPSRPTASSWRSSPTAKFWCRATLTARPTFSSATG